MAHHLQLSTNVAAAHLFIHWWAAMQASSLAGDPLLAGLAGGVLPASSRGPSTSTSADALDAFDGVTLTWRLAWPLTEVVTQVPFGNSSCVYLSSLQQLLPNNAARFAPERMRDWYYSCVARRV